MTGFLKGRLRDPPLGQWRLPEGTAAQRAAATGRQEGTAAQRAAATGVRRLPGEQDARNGVSRGARGVPKLLRRAANLGTWGKAPSSGNLDHDHGIFYFE